MTAAPLHSTTVSDGTTPAAAHAGRLLTLLGATPAPHGTAQLRPEPRYPTHAWAWASGGGAALTGDADGPPLGGPAPVAGAMDGAGAAFTALTRHLATRGVARVVEVDGAGLLGARASSRGLRRAGVTSPGGACRLLDTRDGWIALNLPRQEDRDLLAAWLERDAGPDGWAAIDDAVRDRAADDLAVRGRTLGLAVAAVVRPQAVADDAQGTGRALAWPLAPWIVRPHGPAATDSRRAPTRPPRVIDLSSLWAGPLATALLASAGADVVKVESTRRPDGLRAGDPRFFDHLNHASRSVALDLRDPEGVDALRLLVSQADVVVEASRPRALDQLGCGPQALLGTARPQVWVSITGYGRTGPWRQHPALGDDAGVAGGLAVGDGPPRFCADAVADPAAGLHAALAALACWAAGGSWHVDVAMREVAASLVPDHPEGLPAAPAATLVDGRWHLGDAPVRLPQLPPSPEHAPQLGAHTDEVLREVAG